MPVVERMPFVDCSDRNMRFGLLLVPWNSLVAIGQSPWLHWVLQSIPRLQQIRTMVHHFAAAVDNLQIHSAVDNPVGSDILRRVAAGIQPAAAVAAAGDSPGEDSWAGPEWQLCPDTAEDCRACRSSSVQAGPERPYSTEPSRSCKDWACRPVEGRHTSHHPGECTVVVEPCRRSAGQWRQRGAWPVRSRSLRRA